MKDNAVDATQVQVQSPGESPARQSYSALSVAMASWSRSHWHPNTGIYDLRALLVQLEPHLDGVAPMEMLGIESFRELIVQRVHVHGAQSFDMAVPVRWEADEKLGVLMRQIPGLDGVFFAFDDGTFARMEDATAWRCH